MSFEGRDRRSIDRNVALIPLSYSHTLSYAHTLSYNVLSYSLIRSHLSYSRTLVLPYSVTPMLPYSHTLILSYRRRFSLLATLSHRRRFSLLVHSGTRRAVARHSLAYLGQRHVPHLERNMLHRPEGHPGRPAECAEFFINAKFSCEQHRWQSEHVISGFQRSSAAISVPMTRRTRSSVVM